MSYKVMATDGHNYPLVHVFRDEDQFVDWMRGRVGTDVFDDFAEEEFFDDGEWTDDGGTAWSPYTGLPETDHTGEP